MNKIELKFSACIENEPFVRTSIASFILPLNPDLDELCEVKTIVSEAVSNAIIHGYNYDSSKDVLLKANINPLTRPEQMSLKDFLNLANVIYVNK